MQWIVKELKELLQVEAEDTHLQEVELIIHMLASEMISRGWSLGALHTLVREDLLNSSILVEKRFDKLFKQILSEKKSYVYLFSIKGNLTRETRRQLIKFNVELLDGKTIIDTYPAYNLGSNISEKRNYIRVLGKSYDIQSGVNSMWQKIAERMDILRFYGYTLPVLDTAPIVLSFDEANYTRNISVSLVAKQRKFRAPDRMMDKIQEQLSQGNIEVNRKINSLFEFARISDESLSPKSTFY